MALSVVDLYKHVLPKTNCRDCGFASCLAFASMVVSEMHPLSGCPHLDEETIKRCSAELLQQYAEGKWLKRDMAADALKWASEKAASMKLKDLPERIGGCLVETEGAISLELPYFNGAIMISQTDIKRKDGLDLNRWEKV